MNEKYKWISTGTLTNILATIIAIIALVIAVWEGVGTRHHNRLSVQPKLDFNVLLEGPHTGINLENIGIGPALICSYTIYVDDQPMENRGCGGWNSAVMKLGIQNIPSLKYSWYNQNQGIGVGEKTLLISIDSKDCTQKIRNKLKSRINIYIKYKSFYGDINEVYLKQPTIY